MCLIITAKAKAKMRKVIHSSAVDEHSITRMALYVLHYSGMRAFPSAVRVNIISGMPLFRCIGSSAAAVIAEHSCKPQPNHESKRLAFPPCHIVVLTWAMWTNATGLRNGQKFSIQFLLQASQSRKSLYSQAIMSHLLHLHTFPSSHSSIPSTSKFSRLVNTEFQNHSLWTFYSPGIKISNPAEELRSRRQLSLHMPLQLRLLCDLLP